jgi:hypothetical protein
MEEKEEGEKREGEKREKKERKEKANTKSQIKSSGMKSKSKETNGKEDNSEGKTWDDLKKALSVSVPPLGSVSIIFSHVNQWNNKRINKVPSAKLSTELKEFGEFTTVLRSAKEQFAFLVAEFDGAQFKQWTESKEKYSTFLEDGEKTILLRKAELLRKLAYARANQMISTSQAYFASAVRALPGNGNSNSSVVPRQGERIARKCFGTGAAVLTKVKQLNEEAGNALDAKIKRVEEEQEVVDALIKNASKNSAPVSFTIPQGKKLPSDYIIAEDFHIGFLDPTDANPAIADGVLSFNLVFRDATIKALAFVASFGPLPVDSGAWADSLCLPFTEEEELKMSPRTEECEELINVWQEKLKKPLAALEKTIEMEGGKEEDLSFLEEGKKKAEELFSRVRSFSTRVEEMRKERNDYFPVLRSYEHIMEATKIINEIDNLVSSSTRVWLGEVKDGKRITYEPHEVFMSLQIICNKLLSKAQNLNDSENSFPFFLLMKDNLTPLLPWAKKMNKVANGVTMDFEESDGFHPFASGGPSLPNRGLPDEANQDGKYIKSFTGSHAGQIFFAKQTIPKYIGDDSSLCSQFTAGEGIFCRASWQRAITNYPIAKNDKGELIFGQKYLFNWSQKKTHALCQAVFLYIDGKRISNPNTEVEGSVMCSWFGGAQMHPSSWREYNPDTTTPVDFYAFTTTCRFGLLTPYKESEGWEPCQMATAIKALSSLAPGEHKIKVEMRYQIFPATDNLKRAPYQQIYPLKPLPISDPIATGEFTYKALPNNETICFDKGLTWLPVRCSTLSSDLCDAIEKEALQLLAEGREWGKQATQTEEPIYVKCRGDFFTSALRKELVGNTIYEYPASYGVPVSVVFYRNPETGWEKERVVIFHLNAITPQSPNPTKAANFNNVSVGGNDSDFLFDDLPEFMKKSVKRCPECMRN